MTLPRRRGVRSHPQPHVVRRRRPRVIVALAWSLPTFLLLALLVSGQPAGQHDGSASLRLRAVDQKSTLIKLKGEADEASASLSSATKSYRASKSRYRLAQVRLKRTKSQAAREHRVYAKTRERVASFAAAAYSSPLPNSTSVLLTAANPRKALRMATSMDVVTRSETLAIHKASRQQAEATRLVTRTKRLTKSIAKQRSALRGQVAKLRKQSRESTRRLTQLLSRLNNSAASRGSRVVLAATCGDKKSSDIRVSRFSNGLIPDWALCTLPGYQGKRLRPEAAKTFTELNDAYARAFGRHICVTDAYRSLSEQQSVYARKPGLAAVPGTSNHGWGFAVDLGCGIQDYGSAQFTWMKKHGPEYGWVHPAWAEHSPFEPWHWEYEPGTHTEEAPGQAPAD